MSTPPKSPASDDSAELEALRHYYGEPSQAGFGSAVFRTPANPAESLDDEARAQYEFFVGDLWQKWGAATWLAQWTMVYLRPEAAARDIVAELRAIQEFSVRNSVPMLLDARSDPEAARTALSAVFDAPAVNELRVFRLGDGDMVSGVLIAARRAEQADAVFLAFLMD